MLSDELQWFLFADCQEWPFQASKRSDMSSSIQEMEYQLQAARRTFNAAVVDFNNAVQMFPSNIVASMKHYQLYDLITIPLPISAFKISESLCMNQ